MAVNQGNAQYVADLLARKLAAERALDQLKMHHARRTTAADYKAGEEHFPVITAWDATSKAPISVLVSLSAIITAQELACKEINKRLRRYGVKVEK